MFRSKIMKHKIFISNIIVILFLSFIAYSQTPKSKTKTDKQEQREIEKFADEFMKDLKLTNDLSQVSEKFFVADFKTRLAKNGSLNFLSDNNELKAQISDSDLYYNKVAFINFLNLQTMFAAKNLKLKNEDEDSDDDEDSNTKEILKKYLPTHIIELIKRSKWLREFLDYDEADDKDKIMTVEDIRSITADLNIVSDALRAEITQHKMKFPKSSEMTKYYPGEKCEGESCFGLPENTVIFAIHKYLMCLRIARINNELKIVELFSVADED